MDRTQLVTIVAAILTKGTSGQENEPASPRSLRLIKAILPGIVSPRVFAAGTLDSQLGVSAGWNDTRQNVIFVLARDG